MDNRKIVEANVIFSLLKNTDLFKDYMNKLDIFNSFVLEESQFFFSMGLNLIKQNYKIIDEVAIENYLIDKPSTKQLYIEYGGWNTIKEMLSIVEVKNFEKYYDDLLKFNIIGKMSEVGIDTSKIKTEDMSTSNLYDYYDHLINDLFIKAENESIIEQLDISDKYLDSRINGEGIGASIAYACPRLNYDIGGLRTKNVIIVGGSSGAGKSSFAFENLVIPLVKQKIKLGIISNEQDANQFRDILLTSVLVRELKYYNITRKKLQSGTLNEEDLKQIKKAKEIIKTDYAPYITFVKMFNYSGDETKKVIKKLAREGISHILYDTMKADDSANANFSGQLVEMSKDMFNLADKLEVCIIWTQQASLHSLNTRYLSMYNLAGSKQVSEVASQIIMIRSVWDDEYLDEKYDLQPYNFKKGSDGTYVKDEHKHAVKELFEIDKDNSRNMLVFLAKNRFGEADKVYVNHQKAIYNTWNELGFANVSHINRN